MNTIIRIINRWRFRKTIKEDQSQNVVDGIVKAKTLYKELCQMAHPDRHQEKKDIAEEIMKRVVVSRHNYSKLLSLKKEIEDRLYF